VSMELNGISSAVYQTATYTAKESKKVSEAPAKAEEASAVYEKSETVEKATYDNKNPKVDQATIDKLKADAEARFASLASLVEKCLSKQGETYKFATLSDLMKGVVSGEVEVDPAVVEQAKKDVAEDGYWGVEQTAERIVSFAKALTGGDASKLEEMRKAIDKGFGDAEELWGDELPEISAKTRDRINEMLDEWAAE
ncbi:MAG: hypothetical protein J6A59_04540, partial [Lachnospiraceae bacterium]|nr:hypothetical protein [Lachnospiraceae bacterium]